MVTTIGPEAVLILLIYPWNTLQERPQASSFWQTILWIECIHYFNETFCKNCTKLSQTIKGKRSCTNLPNLNLVCKPFQRYSAVPEKVGSITGNGLSHSVLYKKIPFKIHYTTFSRSAVLPWPYSECIHSYTLWMYEFSSGLYNLHYNFKSQIKITPVVKRAPFFLQTYTLKVKNIYSIYLRLIQSTFASVFLIMADWCALLLYLYKKSIFDKK